MLLRRCSFWCRALKEFFVSEPSVGRRVVAVVAWGSTGCAIAARGEVSVSEKSAGKKLISKIILLGVFADLVTKVFAHWLLIKDQVFIQTKFIEVALIINRSGQNTLSEVFGRFAPADEQYWQAVASVLALMMSLVLWLWIKPSSEDKTSRRILVVLGVLYIPVFLSVIFPEPNEIGSWAIYFQKVHAIVVVGWALILVRSQLLRVGCALMFAGGLGNLINQFFVQGGVTDFIGFPPLYAFIGIANLADFQYYAGLFLVLLFPLTKAPGLLKTF